MNVKELIEKIEGLNKVYGEKFYVSFNDVLDLVKQLDEPETGHADEAPRYVKNILARLRELPLHDREVWLKAIMGEFEQDFSHAKWREGYEQGKFEGIVEREKVKIPQFVAGWIEYCKFTHVDLQHALIVGDVDFYNYANQKDFSKLKEFLETENNQETFARAWLDGYEVEEEKLYFVKITAAEQYLVRVEDENFLGFLQSRLKSKFTRKQLEETGFGWVFSCEGIEVEEVE